LINGTISEKSISQRVAILVVDLNSMQWMICIERSVAKVKTEAEFIAGHNKVTIVADVPCDIVTVTVSLASETVTVTMSQGT